MGGNNISKHEDLDFKQKYKDHVQLAGSNVIYSPSKILGRSSTGKVYLGFNEELKIQVAVKHIYPKYVNSVAENEINIWKKIAHKENIIRIYDCYNDPEDGMFLVLEHATRTFKQQILSFTQSRKQVKTWLRQMCEAVKYLHTNHNKIIHRDIKPENILMVQEGNNLVAKLADFGVSKIVRNEDNTGTHSHAKGTFRYMAPEAIKYLQREKFINTHMLDIYSLGLLILFALSTGSHPFLTLKGKVELSEEELIEMLTKSPAIELENDVAASDLVSIMLHCCPKARPDISEILEHCMFWGWKKKLLFLLDFAREICYEPKHLEDEKAYKVKGKRVADTRTADEKIQDKQGITKMVDDLFVAFFKQRQKTSGQEFNWQEICEGKGFDLKKLLFNRGKATVEYGVGKSLILFLKFLRDKHFHYKEMQTEGRNFFGIKDKSIYNLDKEAVIAGDIETSENQQPVLDEKKYAKFMMSISPDVVPFLVQFLRRHMNKPDVQPLCVNHCILTTEKYQETQSCFRNADTSKILEVIRQLRAPHSRASSINLRTANILSLEAYPQQLEIQGYPSQLSIPRPQFTESPICSFWDLDTQNKFLFVASVCLRSTTSLPLMLYISSNINESFLRNYKYANNGTSFSLERYPSWTPFTFVRHFHELYVLSVKLRIGSEKFCTVFRSTFPGLITVAYQHLKHHASEEDFKSLRRYYPMRSEGEKFNETNSKIELSRTDSLSCGSHHVKFFLHIQDID